MFFCDTCAKKKKWPKSLAQSFGPCEVCGVKTICNDVPTAALPKDEMRETSMNLNSAELLIALEGLNKLLNSFSSQSRPLGPFHPKRVAAMRLQEKIMNKLYEE